MTEKDAQPMPLLQPWECVFFAFFLAKDLHISEKSCNFAKNFENHGTARDY